MPPRAAQQVRQAELDFVAHSDEAEKKTREKIAEAVGSSLADVPPPPRPGQNGLGADAYLQALERKVAKPLTPAQKDAVTKALQDHRDELQRGVDRFGRELTAAVPRLTREQATEILAPFGAN